MIALSNIRILLSQCDNFLTFTASAWSFSYGTTSYNNVNILQPSVTNLQKPEISTKLNGIESNFPQQQNINFIINIYFIYLY